MGADLENGIYGQQPPSVRIDFPFVVAMVKGGSGVPGRFAIKTGNAQKAGSLRTNHDGPRPKGYAPMKKKGAIILGIGGGEYNQHDRLLAQ